MTDQNKMKASTTALICTSFLFFYHWVLSALMVVTPLPHTMLGVALPLLLGSISLVGAALALSSLKGRRWLPGLPLLLVIGVIVATTFLSIPLGFSHLIGGFGLIPSLWTVAFLLLAPCSSLFLFSLPERTAVVKTAIAIIGVVTLFALLILLLVGPVMLAGDSIIPLIGFLWLYGVIGLPIIGVLFIIVAIWGRSE